MSVFQRTGSNGSDLGSGGEWVGTTGAGRGLRPRSNDVAILQVGEGLYGTLSGAALDRLQAGGAPTVSITGASTQVTAAPVGIGDGFTLDTAAFLQASNLRIVGEGTAATVEADTCLCDAAGGNDVLTIGAGDGRDSMPTTRGGSFGYDPTAERGTLNLGGARPQALNLGGAGSQALPAATLPAAGDGRLAAWAALAGAALALGLFAAGQPGRLHPSDPAPLVTAAPIVLQDADVAVLRDRAEAARAQLLARPGVAAVTLEGLRQQGVAIDYAPRRLAALGISPQALTAGLQLDAGHSRPGHLALAALGQPGLQSVADRQVHAGGQVVRLGDVALVSRVKLDPPVSTFQVHGVPAVVVRVTPVE